jgi:Flp pilus assembly protein CpaB
MSRKATAATPRFDIRLAVGALLVIGGVVGTVATVAAMDSTQPYLVVTRDIVSGDTITPSDLAVIDMHVRQGAVPYVTADQMDLVAGAITSHFLAAGELIPGSSLFPPQAVDTTTVTVSLGVNGASWLRPGVRVDVWMSPAADQGLFGPPRVVSSGAVIAHLRSEEGFAADPTMVTADIRVIRRDAPAIIGAIANNFPLYLSPLHGSNQ